MNKKAQADIVYVVALIIGIAVIVLITTTITTTLNTNFGDALGDISPEAQNATQTVFSIWHGWADSVAVIAIIFAIISLFIFSFLVNIHPIFLFLYIILTLFLAIFSPYIIGVLEDLFLRPEMADATAQLPATFWIIDNFGIILIAIIVISGIIMFAKIRPRNEIGGGSF